MPSWRSTIRIEQPGHPIGLIDGLPACRRRQQHRLPARDSDFNGYVRTSFSGLATSLRSTRRSKGSHAARAHTSFTVSAPTDAETHSSMTSRKPWRIQTAIKSAVCNHAAIHTEPRSHRIRLSSNPHAAFIWRTERPGGLPPMRKTDVRLTVEDPGVRHPAAQEGGAVASTTTGLRS